MNNYSCPPGDLEEISPHKPAANKGTVSFAGLGPSKLYSWGWNASGQLGREADDDVSAGSPGEVLLPDDDVSPVMAAAGRAHSVAVGDVTDGGRECYGWGSGR